MFLWTKPFSAGVWCLLMTAILVYAFGMPFFEGGNSNDFADVWHKPSTLVGHALYLGAMGPSKPDTFEPSSGAGRAAAALNAFAMLLIISTYTANLASIFTTMDPAVQDVTDIHSFSSRVAACARTSTTMVTLLNASYPNAAAALTANNTFGTSAAGSRDALTAVLAGSCAGAIVPQTEAAWIMGINDTQGALCELQVVGSPEGDEAMPLTFSKTAMTDAQLESLNMAIEDLQRAGDFLLSLERALFPTGPRAVCAQEDGRDAAAAAVLLPAQQVQVIDLAGAFLLQAIGMALGVLIHTCKCGRKRVRGWRDRRASREGAGVEAAADKAGAAAAEEQTRREALGGVAAA